MEKKNTMTPLELSNKQFADLSLEFANQVKFEPGKSSMPELIESLGGRIRYCEWNEYFRRTRTSLIVAGPGDFDVSLLAVHGPLLHNYQLAKCLAYYVLFSEMGEKMMEADKYESGQVSIEAAKFALYFLMPVKEFSEAIEKAKSILDVSGRFNVSPITILSRQRLSKM
jgi:hypothetical protein